MQHGGKDGKAIPSAPTLGRELGFSESHTRKLLTQLRDHELITSQQRGLGRSNTYQLLWHGWIEEAHSEFLIAEAQKATSAAGQEPYMHLEDGKLVGDTELLEESVIGLILSEYGADFFSEDEWDEAIIPGYLLTLREQGRYHAIHGLPVDQRTNLYPQLLDYLRRRYSKPEGMSGKLLPIDSLLRIDMTCGMIDSDYRIVGLRPLEKKEMGELTEACRQFHQMLDKQNWSIQEYVDWVEGAELSEPVTFTDILNRKLFSEFGHEKFTARKMLKKKRNSEAARSNTGRVGSAL